MNFKSFHFWLRQTLSIVGWTGRSPASQTAKQAWRCYGENQQDSSWCDRKAHKAPKSILATTPATPATAPPSIFLFALSLDEPHLLRSNMETTGSLSAGQPLSHCCLEVFHASILEARAIG